LPSRCDSIAGRDRLLAERRFAALVTDVMLTDGDGIETLGRVRAMRPDMPVIILSAQNTLDTAVRASDTNAFEYFPKPFDIDELVRTVRQAPPVRRRGCWRRRTPGRACRWWGAAPRCRRSTG
jgi:two-component system nitrogen regulation response regulator GlnG